MDVDVGNTCCQINRFGFDNHTAGDDYLYIINMALYLLNIITLKNKTYVVSLQMICCVQQDTDKL